MTVALVTGSGGLIGSEAARHFAALGMDVVGIDNDMRRYFFGEDGSTAWSLRRLTADLGQAYTHHDVDIRDRDGLERVFRKYGSDIGVVIHSAAQPSHDWAAKEPYTDFDVNAVGTLNVLENTRRHAVGESHGRARLRPILAQEGRPGRGRIPPPAGPDARSGEPPRACLPNPTTDGGPDGCPDIAQG